MNSPVKYFGLTNFFSVPNYTYLGLSQTLLFHQFTEANLLGKVEF